MKTPLYLLQGTLFRNQDNLSDLVEINEEFQDRSLIESRKRAFSKFQSYVDVLLESQGLIYDSHEQAEKNLNVFYTHVNRKSSMNTPDSIQIDKDFDRGLFLYLVTDPTDIFTTLEGEKIYNKKHLIHFINGKSDAFKKLVFNALQLELDFYKCNTISIKNHKCGIYISRLFKEVKIIPILKTPIDFQKLPKITLAEIY